MVRVSVVRRNTENAGAVCDAICTGICGLAGVGLECSDDITEPFDPMSLPLSGTKRPYWDVELLRSLGFGEVHSEFDLTDRLWDDKERLLYGETPLFGFASLSLWF